LPVYEVQCEKCEAVEDVDLHIDEPVPACACGGSRVRLISSPRVTRVAEISGPIWSEKQIVASHGERWRETSKSGRPGGDRKAEYYYPGCPKH
jgi:hypothetical protein